MTSKRTWVKGAVSGAMLLASGILMSGQASAQQAFSPPPEAYKTAPGTQQYLSGFASGWSEQLRQLKSNEAQPERKFDTPLQMQGHAHGKFCVQNTIANYKMHYPAATIQQQEAFANRQCEGFVNQVQSRARKLQSQPLSPTAPVTPPIQQAPGGVAPQEPAKEKPAPRRPDTNHRVFTA